MSKMTNGIKAMASVPVNAIKNVGKSIVGGVKSVLRIKSPTRATMEFGELATIVFLFAFEEEIEQISRRIDLSTFERIEVEDE